MNIAHVLSFYTEAKDKLCQETGFGGPYVDMRDYYWYVDHDVWFAPYKIMKTDNTQHCEEIKSRVVNKDGLSVIRIKNDFGDFETFIFDNEKRQGELES